MSDISRKSKFIRFFVSSPFALLGITAFLAGELFLFAICGTVVFFVLNPIFGWYDLSPDAQTSHLSKKFPKARPQKFTPCSDAVSSELKERVEHAQRVVAASLNTKKWKRALQSLDDAFRLHGNRLQSYFENSQAAARYAHKQASDTLARLEAAGSLDTTQQNDTDVHTKIEMTISAFPKLPDNLNKDLRRASQPNAGYGLGASRMVSGGNYAAGGALLIVGTILVYRKLKKQQTQLLEVLNEAEAEASTLAIAFKGIDEVGAWCETYCDVILERISDIATMEAELAEATAETTEAMGMKLRYKSRVLKAEMGQYPND